MMDPIAAQIQRNLETVKSRIAEAAQSAGRNPNEIRLLVVSKAQPVEIIRAAYSAGVRSFGENYPQEAEVKIDELADLKDIEWHMIGHLQSRKAPIIARCFQMIHSIDSLHLAQKLNQALEFQNRSMPALLEVNVGGEDSKFGWQASSPKDWERLIPEFEQILRLSYLTVRGIMTMPPLTTSEEEARRYFRLIRQLRDFLSERFSGIYWKELSMGTSSDYMAAVQEGSTIVRVGQAVLGPRPPKN